ncbi:hypothetical protein [Mesorhizobium sp. ORM16]
MTPVTGESTVLLSPDETLDVLWWEVEGLVCTRVEADFRTKEVFLLSE